MRVCLDTNVLVAAFATRVRALPQPHAASSTISSSSSQELPSSHRHSLALTQQVNIVDSEGMFTLGLFTADFPLIRGIASFGP